MPALDNWIDFPFDVIQKIYDKHGGNRSWEQEADEYFKSRLSDREIWNSVKSVNEVPLANLRNSQLVRFRCMIQDQFGTEMYSSKILLKNAAGDKRSVTGKFRDEMPLQENEEVAEWDGTCSRHVYYCVPIPGETRWVQEIFSEISRKHQGDTGNCIAVGKKRSFEESDLNELEEKKPCLTATTSEDEAKASPRNQNLEKILNFPLPSSEKVGCIVKMYCEEEASLNSVMEVLGIISLTTTDIGSEDEGSEFQPPPTIIPRIHCLAVNKWIHNNPCMTQVQGLVWESDLANTIANVFKVRDELHGLFTEIFAGDSLAADYLLCHLASHVYIRRDALALGKLSLNFSNVLPSTGQNRSFSQSLYNLIEMLVTKSHFLPMSLQNMNTLRLIPKKDYEQNRLLAGRLQLSPNTHLVLDETVMSEGQLIADGVRNMTALGNISSWQKIEYDFNFHQIEFQTDIPVLIFSERRSMIATDVHLPLSTNPNGVNLPELTNKLEKNMDLLMQMRNYITALKSVPFNMGDAMQNAVQQDFIESRASGQTNPLSPEDFHMLLVLSRLLAVTYGKTELTESLWQRAKAMETERKSRITSRR